MPYKFSSLVVSAINHFLGGAGSSIWEAILEQRAYVEGGFIMPDAIGLLNGREVYIEFANTHFVDERKKEILEKLHIPSFEFDLSATPLDEEAIITLFSATSTYKSWLCNPYLDKQYQEHLRKLEEEKKKLEEVQAIKSEQRKKDKEERKKRKEEAFDKVLLQWELDKVVNQSKYNKYKAEGKYRLLISSWNRNIISCPIRKEKIIALKSTAFYRHPVLKKIIDGAFWNGVIYGYTPNGKWIFLGGKQEHIFPPDYKLGSLSEEASNSNKLFYKGLMEVKAVMESSSFGICSNCEYSVEKLTLESQSYEVCRYPK